MPSNKRKKKKRIGKGRNGAMDNHCFELKVARTRNAMY